MADVFISYSRKDETVAREIAGRLQALDVSVWMDSRLESGAPFDAQIVEQLEEATIVVALWSPDATVSDWVRGEAQYGREQGKYLGVMLRGPSPAIAEADGIQPADLRTWPRNDDYTEWRYLLDAIGARLGRAIGGRPLLSVAEIDRRRREGDLDGRRQKVLADVAKRIKAEKAADIGWAVPRFLGIAAVYLAALAILLGLAFAVLLAVGFFGNSLAGLFSGG